MKPQLLDELIFESQFRQLGDDFSMPVLPLGISKPKLVIQSPTLSEMLGLSPSVCSTQPFLDFFSGNASPQNSLPAAQAYAGHQFGKFNPFLGDGRTLLLGKVGTQNGHWEISLKGLVKPPSLLLLTDEQG